MPLHTSAVHDKQADTEIHLYNTLIDIRNVTSINLCCVVGFVSYGLWKQPTFICQSRQRGNVSCVSEERVKVVGRGGWVELTP